MRFKKRELTKETHKIIMHDLECLELKDTKDNKYHYNLLKENLSDIFNMQLNNDNEIIKIQHNGNYTNVLANGIKMATYSKRSGRIYGITKYFSYLYDLNLKMCGGKQWNRKIN